MTKRQAMQKVRELAQTARHEIIKDAEHLLSTGAIELWDYDDNYELPKILITASLERKKGIFYPLTDGSRATLKNLLMF